jgi:hypothetical protein
MTHVGARECNGDSVTSIGKGRHRFNIELSLAGRTSEWIYCKPKENRVLCVCELDDLDLPMVLAESDYQFKEGSVTIHLDKWVLVRNVYGSLAAIRLTRIDGNQDHTKATITFVYAIFEVQE